MVETGEKFGLCTDSIRKIVHWNNKELGGIPAKHKKVYELRQQGLKVAEIAEQTGYRPITVHNILYRERKARKI